MHAVRAWSHEGCPAPAELWWLISDRLPRQVREEQQVERSKASQSEDEQDRAEEDNCESSVSVEGFNGELGQLCRAEAVDRDAVPEASEAEEEDRSLLGALSVGGKRPRAEGEDGLSALL